VSLISQKLLELPDEIDFSIRVALKDDTCFVLFAWTAEKAIPYRFEVASAEVESFSSLAPNEVLFGKRISVSSVIPESDRRGSSGNGFWDHPIGTILKLLNREIDRLQDEKIRREAVFHSEQSGQAVMDAANCDAKWSRESIGRLCDEMRNPLNGIMGYAEALSSSNENSADQGNLGQLLESAECLSTFVDRLAEETADRPLRAREQSFEVKRLLERVWDQWSLAAHGRNVSLTIHVGSTCPRFVVGDLDLLVEVLQSFLEGALSGGNQNQVELLVSSRGKDRIAFEFPHSASGMEQKGREDSNRSASDAVRELGGEVVVEEGGRVTLLLPMSWGPAFTPLGRYGEYSGNGVDGPSSGGQPNAWPIGRRLDETVHCRVLVVDDLAGNREILKKILVPLGFHVTVVQSGLEGVSSVLDEGRYDLLLLDLEMPGMSGFEVNQQLRTLVRREGIVVIAMSGSSDSQVRERANREGFDDFLPKPFCRSDVIETMERHLKLRWKTSHAGENLPSRDQADGDFIEVSPDFHSRFRSALEVKNVTELRCLATELASERHSASAADRIDRFLRAFDFHALGQIEFRIRPQ
ncbi:MAG: response regulator, partial [Verrucomicrobiota bacterium]